MKKKQKEREILKGVNVSVFITEDAVRKHIADILSKSGCKVNASGDLGNLVFQVSSEPAQVLFLDTASCETFLERLNAKDMDLSCLGSERIVVSVEGSAQEAYHCAQQLQGYFVSEPVTSEEIQIIMERMLDTFMLKKRLARYETTDAMVERFGDILVKSPEMKDVVRLARILSNRDDCVMITGPIGTGKELLARTIHEHSSRRHGPFYSINCRSFSSEDLAVELFGRGEPGMADVSKEKNLLELSEGGSLLLDEIGSISPNVQGKLQRFLEDGSYTRVNSRTVCKADMRIFASTATPLDEIVAKGEFSEDLYFRLNRFTLHLPALRRRIEDIPILTKNILLRMAAEKGEEPLKFTEEALKMLMEYHWPGNVRELENVLEFAALVAGNGPIESKHLPKQFHDEVGSIFVGSSADDLPPISEIERRYILRVMDAVRGNKVKAAIILDINRATLHRKLQMYEQAKIAELG